MKELVSLKGVSKYYSMGRKNKTTALSDISLHIYKGETLGIVGESGSGKTTLARVIMGIEPMDKGEILYEGKPFHGQSRKDRLQRAKKAQIIFQDSFGSLDPRMTVGAAVSEGMEIHRILDKEGRKRRTAELLDMIGLERDHGGRYPHEFSGGQRQRIGIARALSVNPEFIVCDEPISALDVSVQSHIMNLLKELQENLGLTYLFISHDLNMVKYISDRIGVMHRGRIVELGGSEAVYGSPQHPYTKLLLRSMLIPKPGSDHLQEMEIQSCEDSCGASWEASGYSGCGFAADCPLRTEICQREVPALKEKADGHFSACHF